MTMDRHEPFEELISASLSGDLTDLERERLDAHLDSCPACRATLAAFAEQRRIMSGLRHVGPPRDLPARVRTGIERGRFATLPWWRRPAVMFAGVGGSLAAVAGALLALVLLNGSPDDNIGATTPTPTPIVSPSATVVPTPVPTPVPSLEQSPEPVTTLPPVVTDPSPSASIVESSAPATASVEPSPTTTPTPVSPEPDVFLALTGPPDNLAMTVQEPQPAGTPAPVAEVEQPGGPAIAAELSPDGQWLAFITELGQSGMTEVRVTRIPATTTDDSDPPETPFEVGETVLLGESVAGAPFTERMAWSPDGRFLAYTLADPEAEQFSSDVWLFEPENGHRRLTNVGNAYVASWVAEDDDAMALWLSVADDEPASYLLSFSEGEVAAAEPIDPADHALAAAENVFQPVLSPNGTLAIYWAGGMTRQAEGGAWVMSAGGAPMLAEHDVVDGTFEFGNERPLFSDVTVRRDAFSSAQVTWGADGDAYAVWDTQWTGESQGDDDALYPDPSRVYFGHATDARGLTQQHAIDEDDLPEETSVVDVKVSPTGEHLLVTVRHPLPGDLSPPRADLLLIERNTGDEADVVTSLSFDDVGWFGPAAFDAEAEPIAAD
jgi:Putative zinc-finger